MTHTLILGGARSGKSAFAEKLTARTEKRVTLIATAEARDSEMSVRIAQHRLRRDSRWETVEEPIALGDAISRFDAPDSVILVDCLTVWLSNLLFSEYREFPEVGIIHPPPAFDVQRAKLLQALEQVKGDVILVSNEVGLGIVPQGAISRWFVDEAGRLNQAVAACCDRVVFVAAGLPLVLKGAPC